MKPSAILKIFALTLFILIVHVICDTSDKSIAYSAKIQAEHVPDYLSDTCFEDYDRFFSLTTVKAFYKQRHYRTAWSKNERLTRQADSVIQIIRDSNLYGLNPEDYRLSEIESLIKLLKKKQHGDSTYLEQMDKLLTNSFFTMAFHLKTGRMDVSNYRTFEKPTTPDSTLIQLLEKGLLHNALRKELEYLEPAHPQYKLLKNALKERATRNNIGVQEESLPDIERVTEEEIRLITINLERWRQEIKTFPDEHIFINIPAFNLQIVKDLVVVLQSRVIVGKPSTSTPLLDSKIECFTIYPYWTVPRSIATQELLPKIKKDVTYLKKHYYQILDSKGTILDPNTINWSTLDAKNFPYRLRQTEGDFNALGVVKFIFDNPYSVYLHDTNARGLFQKEMRALSHGCIRLEKHLELAQYLLRNDSAYNDPLVLQKLFKMQRRKTINLLEPVSIYTRYYTVEVINDSLHFYKDVYKKDEKLLKTLFGAGSI